MPPRPARFSKSTKAAKPAAIVPAAAAAADPILEQQELVPSQQQEQQQHKRTRTCSVEVVITPTKKRRVVNPAVAASTERDHVDDALNANVMVTPTKTKSRVQASQNFLPTPPVTPTISISEHDAEEDDAASICLRTPSTSASGSASSSRRVAASPSPSPSPSSSYNANIYARARSLLRLSAHGDSSQASSPSSSSSRLVGRQAEREQLDAFLRCHFTNLYEDVKIISQEETSDPSSSTIKKAKAMYISGSPGTGKTALLQDILQDITRRSEKNTSMRMSLLNCTTIQRPDDVWARLAEELDLALPATFTSGKGKAKPKWTAESFREALTGSQSVKSLVVLDEIDHLLPDTPSSSSTTASSSNTNVLSELFSIALDPSSNLVLIGIANALDLTQRYSSLLFGSLEEGQAEETHGQPNEMMQNGPELLHFRPFQSDEMVAIVKQRLNTLHEVTSCSTSLAKDEHTGEGEMANTAILPLPIMMPAALELAAKKVASVTGDLRSFLSLIRKAVEIFENEQRKRLLEMQSTSDAASGPISPTKNMLACRNRKRKLSTTTGDHENDHEDEDKEEKKLEDPLLKFDAKTAPKLTPSHILKATRVVSLVSSSSANNRPSSSNGNGINSSAGSLNTSSSSSNNLLQSKISELNLHQRLALTTFWILLARRISSKVPTWSMIGSSSSANNNDTTIDVDAEASSIPNGGARPSELHSLYKTLLEKEDLLHPVSSSEFSDLLSGLHTRGLIGLEKEMSRFTSSIGTSSAMANTLAPPMMRRSSSSSSISSNGAGSAGRTSRSPSPNSKNTSGAQAPLYLLYPFTSLQAVLSPPPLASATSTSSIPPKAATTEASSLCSNLLVRESKRLKRIQKQNEQLEIQRKENELAPRAGFNGDGLDNDGPSTSSRYSSGGGVSYVGEKDKRGRGIQGEVDGNDDDDMEVDLEKQAKLQEEEDEKKENDATPSDWQKKALCYLVK